LRLYIRIFQANLKWQLTKDEDDDNVNVINVEGAGTSLSGGTGDIPPPQTLTQDVKNILQEPNEGELLYEPTPVEIAWLASLNNSALEKTSSRCNKGWHSKNGIDRWNKISEAGTNFTASG